MSKRKVTAILLAAMLCVLVAGCGKDKEAQPDELQTPQYSVEAPSDLAPPTEDEIHTSDKGVKVIAPQESVAADNPQIIADEAVAAAMPAVPVPAVVASVTPNTVWEADAVVTYNAFTLPEKAAFDNGSIGVLSIDKIGLAVNVYESSDQMEDMAKGVAHFKSTSAWDGNCGLSGHNSTASGYGAYFKDLHLLVAGDTVIYRTALGEREYIVTSVRTIGDEDWSVLSRSAENMLTMITCTFSDASKRLMVQAVEA